MSRRARRNHGTPGTSGSAVHRAIVCVDVQGYGDQSRTNADQIAVREGLYSALECAFSKSGVPWKDCSVTLKAPLHRNAVLTSAATG